MKKQNTTKAQYFKSAKGTVDWWEGEFKKDKKATPLQKDVKRLDALKSERVKTLMKGSLFCYAMASSMKDEELFIDDISKSESVAIVSKKLWFLGIKEAEKAGELELLEKIMCKK